jgi:hypothetical protein
MLFWVNERLDISFVFVTINTLVHLYYIGVVQPAMDTSSTSSVLTHINSKMTGGIGILDFVHNGSAAFYQGALPSTTVKVATGLLFGVASACSDWIFGGCLVYDLLALTVGQTGTWGSLLAAYTAGSAAIIGAKNWAR